MEEALLEIHNLSKKFGKHLVLDGVTFDVDNKDLLGIIGLSGSGKTTLLNILIGFWKPSRGEILFSGGKISRNIRAIRQLFGFATQGGSFYNKLTVRENLIYFGRLYGMNGAEIKERTDELLSFMELEDAIDVLADNLSKGMQRRLDMACAMLHDPKVLIMDEPTEDLDPGLRKEILALIRKINQTGTTILITSHQLRDMENICSKIAILHNGKILEVGAPEDIKTSYSKNEEILVETYPGNYNAILKKINKRDISDVVVDKDKLIIYTPKAEKVLHDIINSIQHLGERIVDIEVSKPSLEEVFESLTKASKKGEKK